MQPYELIVDDVKAEAFECVDGSRVNVRRPSKLGALGSGDSSSDGAGVQLIERSADGFGGRGGACRPSEVQLPYRWAAVVLDAQLVTLPVDKWRSCVLCCMFRWENASVNDSLASVPQVGTPVEVTVAAVASELLLGHFWYTLKWRLVGTSNCCTEHALALLGEMANWLELRTCWTLRVDAMWLDAIDSRQVASEAAEGGGGGGMCWEDRADPLWHSEIGM
jgi:hypothetical protein